jgi:ribulose-bisphosphate carboxylase large chain
VSGTLGVRYRLTLAPGEDAEARARQLAREQSIETPAGVAPAAVEAAALGRLAALRAEPGGRWLAEIEYPLAVVGGELVQLLNVLYGNVSLWPGVAVADVRWPAELLARFAGPVFGAAGLRALCRAEPGRPLLAAVLKPLGLSARELARRAAACALGGVDLVKDDHGLADQAWAPFRERVQLCAEHVERANRAVGGATVYAPNLTGPVDRLAERLETLAETGCRAALVAPGLIGLDGLRALAASSGLALVAHPALAGGLAGRERGLAPELLFGDLFRLAGADAVVFPNAGGRFPFTYEDCRALEDRLSASLGGLRSALLVLGGGIDAARLAEWIPRYGPDTAYLIGGSLYARPDVQAGARELADLVRRVPPRAA